MKIEQVTIRNIKSYGDGPTTIEFKDGVNLIAGENGAGKSTILESIGFVLFDALPYRQDDFQRKGKLGPSKVVVQIRSAFDDASYSIERAVPSRYKVTADEHNIDLGIESKEELLEWLHQHLGVDKTLDLSTLFDNAIGMQQGTITSIFLATPGNRQSTLDSLLQVEDYEVAWSNLRDTDKYIEGLQNQAANGQAGLAGQHQQLLPRRAELAELSATLNKEHEELEELEAAVAKLDAENARLGVLEAQVTEWQQTNSELRNLRTELSELERLIDELEPQVEKRGALQVEVEGWKTQHEELDGQIHDLEDERESLEQSCHVAEVELNKRQKAWADYQSLGRELTALGGEKKKEEEEKAEIERQLARRAQLAKEGADVDEAIAAQSTTASQAEADISSAEEALLECRANADLIQEEGGKCPVCQQPVTGETHAEAVQYYEQQERELTHKRATVQAALADATSRLETLRQDKHKLERELEQMANEQALKSIETRLEDLQGKINDKRAALEAQRQLPEALEAAEGIHRDAQQELDEHDRCLDQLKSERQDLLSAIAESSQRMADLASPEALDRETSKHERLRNQVANLETELKRLGEPSEYDEDYHAEVTESLAKKKDEWARLDERISNHEGDKLRLEKQVATLNQVEQDLAAVETKIEKLVRERQAFQFVRRSIREAGPRIRERKVQLISQKAAEYFSEILNDFTMRLHWDAADYGIYVEKGGEVRPFSVFSGGEKMIAALSVRLALLMHMSRVRLIFLDEPTVNLDQNRRVQLAERLSQIDELAQLFVISHDDVFVEESNHVIYIRKENGTSQQVSF